ncbi:sigma-70 family RNA polymerase sigma factor [Bdellovibrionales bacterium]|nr:sigma-70 family RNA polymerase sigma factor [Bdellovibrionales bacterium]
MGNLFSNLTDEKLMELYQSGEYLAFEVIYQRHHSRVFTYLKKRLSDSDVINDVFQNIFIKFHKTRDSYDSSHPLAKWIYTLSRNELLDYKKKPSVTEVEYVEAHQQAEELPEQASLEIEIEKEKSLTQNEVAAIKLRYYSDEDFTEISKRLNVSTSNARKLISRGLKKLRVKYTGDSK